MNKSSSTSTACKMKSIAALVLALTAFPAIAAEKTAVWTGNGSSLLWTEAANWDIGEVPRNNGDTYDVVLGTDATQVFLDERLTVDNLSLADGAVLDISALLELEFNLHVDGVIRLTGIASNEIIDGILFRNDAVITGTGSVQFDSSSEVPRFFNTGSLDIAQFASGTSIDFEPVSVGDDAVIRFTNFNNEGTIRFKDLSAANIDLGTSTDTKRNTGTITFLNVGGNVRLILDDGQTDGPPTGQISIVGPDTPLLWGSISGQDLEVSTPVTVDSFGLLVGHRSTVRGTTIGDIAIDRIQMPTQADDWVIEQAKTIAFAVPPSGEPQEQHLANISRIEFAELPQSDPARFSVGSRIILDRDLELVGPGFFESDQRTGEGDFHIFDFNGHTLSLRGGLDAWITRVEMNGGTASVGFDSVLRPARLWGAQNGGNFDVADGGQILLIGTGILDQVQLPPLGQSLIGGGGHLRDMRIPSGVDIVGRFRLDGDIELDGRALLQDVVIDGLTFDGGLSFADDEFNTLSGDGEVVFPLFGGSLGTNSFTLAPDAILRITGGSGSVGPAMFNQGVLRILMDGEMSLSPSANSGTILVESGDVGVGFTEGSIDNRGGIIENAGSVPVGVAGRIEGGVLRARESGSTTNRTTTSRLAATASTTPSFRLGGTLANVTLEADVETAPSANITLESSLVNQGTLTVVNTDDYSATIEFSAGANPNFTLSGGGTLDMETATGFRRVSLRTLHAVNDGNLLRGEFYISHPDGADTSAPILFENRGTVSAADGAEYLTHDLAEFVNRGRMSLGPDSLWGRIGTTTGTLVNEGILDVAPTAQIRPDRFVSSDGLARLRGFLVGDLEDRGGDIILETDTLSRNVVLDEGELQVNDGNSRIGELEIRSTFQVGEQGRLPIDLAGLTPGETHDLIRVDEFQNLDASPAGTVVVRALDGLIPQPGDRFEFLRYGAPRNGAAFAAVENRTPFPDLLFDIEYEDTATGGSAFLVVSGDPSHEVTADLVLDAAACAPRLGPGGRFSLAILVDNAGPNDAHDVGATAIFPAQAVPDPITLPGNCTVHTSTITCDLGTISANGRGERRVEFDVDPLYSGSLDFELSVDSMTADQQDSDNTATAGVEIIPGLIFAENFETCG